MGNSKYLLGYDIGSSSVKASLIDCDGGRLLGSSSSPEEEMSMISVKSGWAEQEPEQWWKHVVIATRNLVTQNKITTDKIAAIGISYQMHGLVVVDKNHKVLRPSIIWCDSRASEIGNRAFQELGRDECLKHFLNSPGNFTASKLMWVKENEPELYTRIYKVMLPGDYIAMKLTGRICTSVSGLSEGILWDYQSQDIASTLLDYYGISEDLIPEVIDSFENSGVVNADAAEELGLNSGIPVSYRAGDQPNNAYSLNVLNPGEVAATAGTSGVVYGITNRPDYDSKSRVNTFVHVNNSPDNERYGVLLCINGTGILNSWLKRLLALDGTLTYEQMNELVVQAPVGSDGLTVLPFGNGAERILENRDIGAQLFGLNFNRHNASHLLRASQEGIVFALHYGFQIMEKMGLTMDTVKAGHANMFLSPTFREAFVNTTGSRLELYNTDGSQGAARGAGVGAGIFSRHEEAFDGLKRIEVIEPESQKRSQYLQAYERWLEKLESHNL